MNTRSQRKRFEIDLEGLLILGTLLVAGLIPVIAMLVDGPSADYGTNLGFALAVGVLCLCFYEFTSWRRRRKFDASDEVRTDGDPGEPR
jgi:hypothetical protein